MIDEKELTKSNLTCFLSCRGASQSTIDLVVDYVDLVESDLDRDLFWYQNHVEKFWDELGGDEEKFVEKVDQLVSSAPRKTSDIL